MSLFSLRNLKFSGKGLLAAWLLAGLCLLGSGCDMKMPWDPKPKPKAEDGKDAEGQDGEGDSKAEPVQVNELDFLPPDMKKLPFEEINIPLSDGLKIYGRLYDPSQKLESEGDEGGDDKAADSGKSEGDSGEEGYKGPKYPLIILLHGLDRDHTTWSDLPVSLVKAGYSVFAMDLRGHGKSTNTIHQQRVSWRFLEPEQWQLLPKDVDQVIQHFQKDEEHPQIDGKTVGLVGEKLGANVAVFTGRDMNSFVKAIVLISPGLNYKGIIPSQAVIDYPNSALLITTQDDPYSYKSTERLYNWLLGLKALQVYKKIGDGSDMLSHQSALSENITDWLISQMPSPAKPKPVEKKDEAKKITTIEAATKGQPEAKKPEDKSGKAKPDDKKEVEKPAPAKKATPEDKKSPTPPAGEKPKSSKTDVQPKVPSALPKDRLGEADANATKPAAKSGGKKTGKPSKTQKAHKKVAAKKTEKPKATTSAPTPGATAAPANPGQPPIPGG